MKPKTTLLLTLTFFSLMLSASVASAYVGYLMGREALKVVTQPDIQSEARVRGKKPVGNHKGLNLIAEQEILTEVYNRTHPEQQKNQEEDQSQTTESADLIEFAPKAVNITNFTPLTTQFQGVTLMVSNALYEADSLLLELQLKNENSHSVRFLYSFIDIRADRHLPLSAIPEGLPSELPADSQNYRGKLRIPSALLENSKKISLTLTDYPEREIKLQLNNIPISR